MEQNLDIMRGVIVSPLKKIHHPKGDIYHALRSDDECYSGFGEAYFTNIHEHECKGWKKHNKMTMNLIVPIGDVRFFFFCDIENKTVSIVVGESNYVRVTVAPGIWMAFEGLSKSQNLVLNISSIPHDPLESVNVELNTYPLTGQ